MTNQNEVKTIQYVHKSNPSKTSVVPEDFGVKASGLVKFVLETEGSGHILDKIKDYPELLDANIISDMVILAKIKDSPESPEALKLQDSLYLNVCRLCTESIFSSNAYQKHGLGVMLRYLNKEIEEL